MVISNYENSLKVTTLDVLTTMAAIYNASLDYLIDSDKKGQALLNNLTAQQCDLVHRLVKE